MNTTMEHRRRRARSLVKRTRWAFVSMLLWALVTAAVSLAAVNSLVTTLRDEAEQTERETTLLTTLPPTLNEAEGAGHDLIDYGSESVEYFDGLQGEIDGLLGEASLLFDDPDELAAVAELRAAWLETFGPLQEVADDPALGEDVEESLGLDPSELHDHLGASGEQLRTALYELDGTVRRTTRARLDEGESAQRNLTIALAALFAVSLGMTIFFARRIRVDVVHPVRALGSSTRRFASGEFDHRSDVDRPEEFAELAHNFNSMAEVLDANQRTLIQQAFRDSLTGLANRRAFLERLASGFAASAGEPTGVGVLFLDLDDFKVVNDTAGHASGDQLLRLVAARIGADTRSTDLVARLGGDEFAVLLAAPAGRAVAEMLAQRVLDQLDEPIVVDGVPFDVGASIGVALQTARTESAEELLRQADVVMYLAKGRGKRRFEVYDPVEHRTLGRPGS